ncbi:type II and III secretion system protein family protein [Pseudidiomarina terrestris]|uniref:type II and III secretion system protein family protein n=1 Tax=Pseudidiomarina terrestris TaxID=2820060 RepID=UPI00264D5755|nr:MULTISPECIES: pilus assembly protein N-terminal domain-containing protein [unclassified Pseudidiomarina]MDN7128149.1 pilus assembly protein N-terminal domain-containing protein [Pseudidiomarina sp. 1APR75-33.1]MDN7136568.1 pilus assembly protein N-terminal domain-containing protein [Pseudidiomarina sp. 1ASP75-5]
MTKHLHAVIGLLFCLSVQAQPKVFEVRADESIIIPLEGVDEVVITNDQVVNFQHLDSGVLVVTGKQAGTTELLMFTDTQLSARHVVEVKAALDQRLKLELLALQRQFPQLQVHHHDELISISGQLDLGDQKTIERLVERHSKLVSQVEFVQQDSTPMLVIEVRIAEVKRSFARHLGVRWPAHINGPLVENAGQWLHLPISAQSTIDVMERQGQARLLATPTLTAVSGGTAEFLVGGEFPVPQVLVQGLQDVSFRPYGIQLTIAPQLLESGKVQTQLVAEMSSIDPATAVNGIPGLLTRKVASTLVIPAGETMILSGLLQHEQSEQADRFPALHKLPILGALFGSKQFRTAETDLVIMVTPKLASASVERQSRGAVANQQIKDFRRAAGCTGLLEPFIFGGTSYD